MKIEWSKYITAKTLAISSIAILIIIFLIQNGESVAIKCWFWEITIPLSFLILLLLFIGGILTYIFFIHILKIRSKDSEELNKKN